LCAVIPESLQEANSNQDTIKFRPPPDLFDAYFVALWLSSPTGLAFLRREAGGAVQQHVYMYNFKRIPLLQPLLRIQQRLGALVRASGLLRDSASALTTTAQTLVEALIDGKLTEQDLIEAHQSPDKDRALLARLTRKGLDVKGEPALFPDLDALFEALKQVEPGNGEASP
jgi:hypothetical protein